MCISIYNFSEEMKNTFNVDKFNLNFEKPKDSTYVSYSQYSTFSKCQLAWKLKYIDKIKEDAPSIHAVFGTSMHNVIQYWLQVLYTETVKKADSLDFKELLLTELKQNYAADVEKYQKHFSNKEELTEFFVDGYEGLQYLRKKRTTYFDRKNEELIGIEVPVQISTDETRPTVLLIGFLDIVIRDKTSNVFKIFDLKTSTKGWSKWDKEDKIKTSQLLLYKLYFSKQYNIPIEKVNVEYLILKRKIDQDSLWPQRRVQTFSPSQGNISYNKVQKDFQSFLDVCFLPDGSYNAAFNYKAIAGKNGWNCKFCEFRDRTDLCPKQNRFTI